MFMFFPGVAKTHPTWMDLRGFAMRLLTQSYQPTTAGSHSLLKKSAACDHKTKNC